jgi:hypothetical protein
VKPLLFERVRQDALRRPIRTIGSDVDATQKLILAAVPFAIDDASVQAAMYLRGELLAHEDPLLPSLAIPPFPATWIEYSPRAKLPPERITPETADALGHLVYARPDQGGVGVITVEGWKRKYAILPVAQHWSLDGRPMEVRTTVVTPDRKRHPEPMPAYEQDTFRHLMLTGHSNDGPAWARCFGGLIELRPGVFDKESLRAMWDEHRASGSLLMGILALMALMPTARRTVQPLGRWLGRGTTHPFVRHTVVTIQTGERLVYTALRNALAEHERIRRAEHDVRSHWRVIRRGRPDEYRVEVKAHKRGDPALGTVVHDAYQTKVIHRSDPGSG